MSSYDRRQWTGLVLGPSLFIVIVMTAAATGLSSGPGWVAATVILMAVWWITEPLPLWMTAMLPLLVFPLSGATTLFPVVLQYFDPVNFLFLGGMLIAAAMEQWGLHRRIALGIVATIGASPRRIVLGFMLGTGFISMWISNTATTMMMYPIGMAVLLKLAEHTDTHAEELRRFGLALMLGIAYGASIGGIGTKIGTAPNLVFVKLSESMLDTSIDFLTWLKMGLPIVIIALPVAWWYLVRVAAPLPATGFAGSAEVIAAERARLGPMSRGEQVTLVAFLLAAVLWIFRKEIDVGAFTIPGWWKYVTFGWEDILGRPLTALSPPLEKLLRQDSGDAAVAIVIGCALLCIPVSLRRLRFALDLRRAASVPWHLLILLGGGFAMAYGIEESGLSGWFAGHLAGAGGMSPYLIFIVVCFLTVALSEAASNTATASILLPLIAVSADSLGVAAAPLMLAAAIAASFGFMLPAGTPPNAIVYASGYITVPQMARNGILIDLFGVLLVATLCYLLAPWVLGS